MAVETFYLSDVAHDYYRKGALYRGVTMGRFIEDNYAEWVARRVVIRDSGLVELIAERMKDTHAMSIVERGDKPARRFQSPIEYDGVVHQAMFGGWGRRARELKVSQDAMGALAAWVVQEGVVRRRAASVNALASEALELIGRGWTEATDDNGAQRTGT